MQVHLNTEAREEQSPNYQILERAIPAINEKFYNTVQSVIELKQQVAGEVSKFGQQVVEDMKGVNEKSKFFVYNVFYCFLVILLFFLFLQGYQ